MADKKTSIIDPDDLRPVFKFLGKNWFFLLFFPVIAYIGASLHTHRLNDIYAAKTEILLKQQETYDYQSQIYSNFGYYSLMSDVTNQKRILSSYDIISNTLQRLDFGISYYLVGRVKSAPVDFIQALSISVDRNHFASRMYNRPINIKVLDLDRYQLSYEVGGQKVVRIYDFGERAEEIDYLLTIDKSNLINPSTIDLIKEQDFMFLVRPHDWLVNRYKGKLKIESIDFTSILDLRMEDEVPDRAKRFLDTLSNVYIRFTQQSRIQVNENTQRYIDFQLDELEVIMDSLDTVLEDFRDRNRILDLSKEQQQLFNAMVDLDAERRQFELRLQSIDNMVKYLNEGDNFSETPPALFLFEPDVMMNAQLRELYTLKLERQNKLFSLDESNIAILRLDSVIKNVSLGIYKYTLDTRAAIEQRLTDLSGQLRTIERKLGQIPKSQKDILAIDRKLAVNAKLYEFLLEKKASTVIARAAILPEASLVEEARLLGIVGPD